MEQNLIWAALVFLVIATLLLLAIVLRVKNEMRQHGQNQTSVQSDLRALCNAAVQVGERVSRMEAELKALRQRQQELGIRQDKLATSDASEVSFEQAIRLARKGSSVEELMEICDLSRGEAELITMMHRLDKNH